MPPKRKTTAGPRQRTFLTNEQKLQLKQFWSEHPDLQLLAVVDWVRERFGVSVGRATLYRIYHAPAEAFAGNAQQKKGRRVKFPALERDVVAFFEEHRRLNEGGSGVALSDDALLRTAAELRARHGISETELKLSNGWLHRFKERHTLRAIPQATGVEDGAVAKAADAEETWTGEVEVPSESSQLNAGKRKRKPRAPPRRTSASTEHAAAVDGGVAGDNDDTAGQNAAVNTTIATQQPLESDTLEDTTNFSKPIDNTATAIQPLTYVAAGAVVSVAAVGFIRWKLNGGMAHAEHFTVDRDGVSILRRAVYQLNVELQHTSSPVGSLSAVFKVWAGVELLGQCERPIRIEGGRALSVLQLECTLSAQTVVRVEYHAPGVVYTGSRLVLRLLSELT